MKGCSGRSWRDFGQLDAGSRRSAAWIDLLGSQLGAPIYSSQNLSISSAPAVSMFLDSLSKAGSSQHGACGHHKPFETAILPYGGFFSPPSECDRRAALDFVLELAGPRTVSSSGGKMLCPDAFVSGEEVPVPMFAVDRDMHCTMWNRRMEELSNWSEGEVMAMQRFPSSTFQPCQGSPQKSCEDTLNSALFGRDVSGVEFGMKTKDGGAKRVQLFASRRTDAVGALCGVLCVVMPHNLGLPQLEAAECRDGTSDYAEEDRSSGCSSELSLGGTTEPSTPVLPYRRTDSSPRLDRIKGADSPDSKDMFERSVSCSETSVATSCGVGSPKALVVDAFSARRNSLAMQLERCGMEVACASSAREGTWRFSQSLTDDREGPPYSLVFVDLQAESRDGHAAVREIRRMEKTLKPPAKGSGRSTLIVAVTSMNRWDLAGMDNNMDKSMSAGVDAVIPQNIKMQQLRSTLRKLGIRSKYLEVPTTLPRALSGHFHNPLNLSR